MYVGSRARPVRRADNLNISQLYRRQRPVTGIYLNFFFFYVLHDVISQKKGLVINLLSSEGNMTFPLMTGYCLLWLASGNELLRLAVQLGRKCIDSSFQED
jgi:hypothetical protein